MLRKGRCSNHPSKCSAAKDGILLPFAGLGSLCPECGAPLALIASDNEAANPTLPQSTYVPPAQNYSTANQTNDEADYYEEPSRKGNSFVIAAFVLGILALAVVGLLVFKGRGQDNAAVPTINAENLDQSQVAEITPAIIARTNASVDVKSSPSATAASLGMLNLGSVVDVTGRVNIENAIWARINIPNQPSKIGWLPESQLTSLSGVLLSDSLSTNNIAPSTDVVLPPAPPEITPIVEVAPRVLYVQSERANIRAEGDPNATKIGGGLRGDTLTADASRTFNGKIWYRVTMPNGEKGWVSASLLGPNPPPELPPAKEPKTTETTTSAPVIVSEGSRIVISSSSATVFSAAGGGPDSKVGLAERGMVLQVDSVSQEAGQTWYHVKSNRHGIDGWVAATSAKPAQD